MTANVSVIVLTWNGEDYLEPCLRALLAQDYEPFEVIVVDNASTDASVAIAQRYTPSIRLIRNDANLGFAGGNNVGLDAAEGDVIVLLNQDTVVQPGWMNALVETLQSDPAIGIAGAKAFYPDGRLQHAGGYVDEQGNARHYGHREPDVDDVQELRDVDFVTGASLAIARRALAQIGGLDEGFRLAYYEDVDWCYRARAAGFRVVYVPTAVLVHHESSTSIDHSYESMVRFHRNRLRFVLKHWPRPQLIAEFLPLEREWLQSLGQGGERLIAALHHAYLFHLLHLSDLLAWRRDLLGSASDEADDLARVLTQLRTIVPLQPARLDFVPLNDEHAGAEIANAGTSSPLGGERLVELRRYQTLREHRFDSAVPVLGPAIAAFRRLWYSVAAQWSVRSLIEQQNQLNASVVQVLAHLQNDQEQLRIQQQRDLRQWQEEITREMDRRRRLGEVLAEYLAGDGRELAELARKVQELSDLLEQEQLKVGQAATVDAPNRSGHPPD